MEQLTTVRFSNSSAERRFLFGTFLPMCMSTLGTIAAARSISATVGHHTVGVGDLEILLGCKVKAVQCREIGTCRTDRFSSGNRHERVFGKVMHGYLNLNTDKGDGLSPERYQERVGREGIVQDSTKLKDLDVLIALLGFSPEKAVDSRNTAFSTVAVIPRPSTESMEGQVAEREATRLEARFKGVEALRGASVTTKVAMGWIRSMMLAGKRMTLTKLLGGVCRKPALELAENMPYLCPLGSGRFKEEACPQGAKGNYERLKLL